MSTLKLRIIPPICSFYSKGMINGYYWNGIWNNTWNGMELYMHIIKSLTQVVWIYILMVVMVMLGKSVFDHIEVFLKCFYFWVYYLLFMAVALQVVQKIVGVDCCWGQSGSCSVSGSAVVAIVTKSTILTLWRPNGVMNMKEFWEWVYWRLVYYPLAFELSEHNPEEWWWLEGKGGVGIMDDGD